MYVLKTVRRPAYSTQHLFELSPRELARQVEAAPEGVTFEKISGREAHRYVREGGVHSTDLFVDRGRVRRADDDEDARSERKWQARMGGDMEA
jgi:hypothetical protein